MNSDNNANRLIEAALLWDVPALLSAGPRASAFVEIMNLAQPALEGEQRPTDKTDTNPLAVAADGLTAELRGDSIGAISKYRQLQSADADLSRLLGALLEAWMPTSEPEQFDRVALLASRARRPIRANALLKLAIWARQRGWVDYSARAFDQAYKHSSPAVRLSMQSFAHHFERQRKLVFGHRTTQLIEQPWIGEILGRVSEDATTSSVVERVGAQRHRTRRLSGFTDNRTRSAIMQADWAGAYWLLLRAKRLQAALLLDRLEDPASDVPEALALWLEGNGSKVEALVDGVEKWLTSETVSQLLINRLARGTRVVDPEAWLGLCSSLWDEMPIVLADELIDSLPVLGLGPVGKATESLSLFAVLLIRDESRWLGRFATFDASQRAAVLLKMTPEVASRIPPEYLRGAIEHVLDRGFDEIGRTGATEIDTLAKAVQLIADPDLKSRFVDFAPTWMWAELTRTAPDLIPNVRLRDSLPVIAEALKTQIEMAEKGSFAVSSRDLTIRAARTMIALDEVDNDVVGLIVTIANSEYSSSEQARMALVALDLAFSSGLINAGVISLIEEPRSPARSGGFWEGPEDLRLEQVERASVASSSGRPRLLEIVAAGRDPDIRVRARALRGVVRLASANKYPALDGAFLGALYDPEPALQTWGVRGLVDDLLTDQTVKQIGWSRLLEQWPESARPVRLAIARGVSRMSPEDMPPEGHRLLELARSDRSIVVRAEAGAIAVGTN